MSESPSGDNTLAQQPEQIVAPGRPFSARQVLPSVLTQTLKPAQRGRRSLTRGTTGHFVRAVRPNKKSRLRDIAVMATLRAMALRQAYRPGRQITRTDIRVKERRQKIGNLILFVVDASGSMGARKRMVAVKGAILSLLMDAYQKRDQVGLITFRGQRAELLLPPTNSVVQAERLLRQMPTGGRTPLGAGLQLAAQLITTQQQREGALSPLLVLLTDGRANVGDMRSVQQTAAYIAKTGAVSLVLDCEQGFVTLGKAQTVASWLAADYLPLDQIQAGNIVRHIQRKR